MMMMMISGGFSYRGFSCSYILCSYFGCVPLIIRYNIHISPVLMTRYAFTKYAINIIVVIVNMNLIIRSGIIEAPMWSQIQRLLSHQWEGQGLSNTRSLYMHDIDDRDNDDNMIMMMTISC